MKDSAYYIYEEIEVHSKIMMALGELIESSSLEAFADNYSADYKREDSQTYEQFCRDSNLRWGLHQIIEMYLDKQKKIILKYCAFGIGYANQLLKDINEKEIAGNEAILDLRETIESLDVIIDNEKETFEQEDIIKAKKLRLDCLEAIEALRQERDEADKKQEKE